MLDDALLKCAVTEIVSCCF